MELSVGFENGEQITTWVVPEAARARQSVLLQCDPSGAILAVARWSSSAHFWSFSISRAAPTSSAIRPRRFGRTSAGRTPCRAAGSAFWFFLVIGSFFLLWVITGDYDTLNSSVLALIGISAGTALGAAFVDSGHAPAATATSDLPPEVDLSKPRRKIAGQMRNLIAEAREGLKAIEAQRADVGAGGDGRARGQYGRAGKGNARDQGPRAAARLFRVAGLWKGVMHDLMAENNIVCFHRFQIFIWTIVLGIMFVVDVYNRLAMPEFSATLLGLLGISAGTFVGFKLPETKPKPEAAD